MLSFQSVVRNCESHSKGGLVNENKHCKYLEDCCSVATATCMPDTDVGEMGG